MADIQRGLSTSRGEDAESGRPVWALLGLLAAVSVAILIMTLGFSTA